MQKHVVFELKNVLISREKGGVTFRLEIPKLTIYSGEFIGVIGSSGCGKSTFLDILGLILGVDKAEIFRLYIKKQNQIYQQEITTLFDQKLADIRREYIGYILQSGGLLPFLSVQDNILLSAKLNNISNIEESFYKLVTSLGIKAQINKKPQYLSGGQRQKVAIARALMNNPDIILADEPTGSLDTHSGDELMKIFVQLNEEKRAIILVTHEKYIADFARRIIHLRDGLIEGQNGA